MNQQQYIIYYKSDHGTDGTFPVTLLLSEVTVAAYIIDVLYPMHGSGTYNAVDAFDGFIYVSLTLRTR